jgi:carbamoylphosphate synthase small subunit
MVKDLFPCKINTDNFLHLQDKVMEFNLAKIDEWLKRGVDGIFFSDGWGEPERVVNES